jgi:hypothetical protein
MLHRVFIGMGSRCSAAANATHISLLEERSSPLNWDVLLPITPTDEALPFFWRGVLRHSHTLAQHIKIGPCGFKL